MLTVLLLICSRAVASQTISVSGNPPLVTVTTTIAAGVDPTSVSTSTTTYTVTTGPANRTYKVTAQLNAPMPAGTTLQATFAAPPGAASAGPVALDATAHDLVTGIGRNISSTQLITYTFTATAAAGTMAATSRTVTLTIIRFP